jgi:hypothetical protein
MDEGIQHIGRVLIIVGVAIALVGVVFVFAAELPWLGRLPGDISVHRKNFTFYFPLATSVLISIFLTLLFWLIGKK